MKCMNCGAEIPEEQLICPECGQEIQIVPDYNPLDDVLAAQVKGAVNETLTSGAGVRPRDGRYPTGRTAAGRNGSGRASGKTGYVSQRTGHVSQRTGHVSQRTGYVSQRTGQTGTVSQRTGRTGRVDGRTGRNAQLDREQKRRQAEKKKMLAKKKRMRRLIILAVVVVIGVVIGVVCYQNSYTGQVKKGQRHLAAREYDQALSRFQKAVSKDNKRSEAYTGMADVYIAQDDLEKAEQVFWDAIEGQSSNTELYRAAITFYIDTEQDAKVSVLLDACESDRVLEELAAFVSEGPEFSLDDSDAFDDVQQLELTGTGKTIYYTMDDTAPTESSTKYTAPIQIPEGETIIRAISVNNKGIPSLEVKKTYTVELPVADAPAVTPSTGQYESSQTITVQVPEGYKAYYTTDDTTPTASSEEYTGPFDMPEGNTILSVVLINDSNGKASGITKRNYELILE